MWNDDGNGIWCWRFEFSENSSSGVEKNGFFFCYICFRSYYCIYVFCWFSLIYILLYSKTVILADSHSSTYTRTLPHSYPHLHIYTDTHTITHTLTFSHSVTLSRFPFLPYIHTLTHRPHSDTYIHSKRNQTHTDFHNSTHSTQTLSLLPNPPESPTPSTHIFQHSHLLIY